MSAVPEREPRRPLDPGVCPVCATPVADSTERCPECGLDLAGVAPRPNAYSRTAIVWTVIGFALIYLCTVLAVALID